MNDLDAIAYALSLAKRAAQEGEVPVGAIVVLDGRIIGEGWNQSIAHNDPTAHAEIQAIRQAARHIGNYRLINSHLYVTLEPCTMCLGAMIHARIERLSFGADDPKVGAVRSQAQLLAAGGFNHQIHWQGGLMAEECGDVLRQFFRQKRRVS
jgi:tRNA(adenine34) deaminase